MTRTRSALVVLALFVLALPVITGATTASDAQEGVGDANASLVGAHLEVEDLDGLTSGILGELVGQLGQLEAIDTSGLASLDTAIDLGLLEGLTRATTRDTPDARAALSPLRIGDDRPHDVSAGPGDSTGGDAVTPGPVSALVSNLGVSAFGVSADADEDGAIAQIAAVDATLDALSLTSLDIGLTGVVSEVTRTGASAEQDLLVDGLDLGLGDILPADLLEALPLDVLLDLIEGLGDAGLLDDVDGLRAELDGLVDDISGAIDELNTYELALLGDLDTDTELLEELIDLRDALGALGLDGVIDTLEDTLEDAVEDILDLGIILDPEAALADALALDVSTLGLEDQIAELEEAIALLGDADDIDGIDVPDSCPDELSTELGDLIDDADALAACVEDVLQQIQELVDDLIEQLRNEVSAQLGLDGLLDLLEGLVADLLDLTNLVDTIRGLIDEIAGIELLSADSLGLAVLASADAEGGATSIVCELGGVSVLGDALGDLSCDGGSLGEGVDDALDTAFGVVGDVLESLPGVSGVDGLRLDLLPVATEEVTTDDDGTVTAKAHAVLLELVVPSVTIDPSEALDLLDLPEFGGIAGLETLVEDVLAELEADGLLELLPVAELTTVLEELQEAADELIDDVTGLLGEVGLLDLDVLGISIRTPSISLVLDPVSEATFTPAADDDSQIVDDPGDDPVPADDDPTPTTGDPSELPRTGGGLALLGLLAMLGALGLRRTG
jgi:hypothetical protein